MRYMNNKSLETEDVTLENEIVAFLRDNPEIEKTLKVFNMSLSEYTSAVKSASQEKLNINLKSTQWLPGKK